MTFKKHLGAIVLAIVGGVCAALPAPARGQYDSGGFEPPRFVPGPLATQDPAPPGPWVKDLGTGTAVVQTGTVKSGLQAVQVNRPAAATGDTRWAVQQAAFGSSLQLVRVSWDMNVTGTQVPNVPFGPFFGVEGYDASGSTPLLAGSLGLDATTGDVLIQESGTGAFVETGSVLPFNTWNRFVLEMNYSTKTYQAFVNGNPAGEPEPFVDLGIVGFTDAPISTLAASDGAGLLAPGTAYFDNYSIEVVPEPASMAIIGLASLGLLRRRRAVHP
jgi:PEP-CTERM motif-containing protein